MDTNNNPSLPDDMRDLAKGIAVRAGLLSVVGLIVGAWVFSLAAKAASGVVKVVTGLLLLVIGGSFVGWQVHKVKKHFSEQ